MHGLRAVLWDATWGNNVAWLESTALAGLILWAARNPAGRRAAAWWDRHHGPKAVERHKQALREHEAARQAEGDTSR
jgi:hypothetical protein